LLEECEFEFAFGDDFAVDEAAAAGLADGAADFDDFGFDEEGVSGEDGAAPFDAVGAHEVADFPGVFRFAEHEDGGDLGHGLELEDAGHDGVAGEVAGEEGLVDGDVFDAGAFGVAFEIDNAIDEEERVAVGEDFEDVVDIEDAFALWNGDGRDHGPHARVFGLEGGGHFGVGAVAGFDGDDVAEDAFAGEDEVADEVEGFVACEFVREAQGFLGHDFVAADDDGAFEGSALDEAFFEERFDVFVVDEGACGADFLFVGGGCDFGGEVLGEAPVGADVGDGDAEGFAGDDGDEGAIAGFLVDGFADFPDLARGGLGDDAGFFDEFDEGARGAVTDGGLVGVHFDEGVVDAHASECGEDVFDGVHLDGAFGEGGGALDGLHFVGVCGDERLVREVDAAELEAVAFGGGFEGEGDLGSGVEGGAFKGGRACERVLNVGGHVGGVSGEGEDDSSG